MIAYLDNSATTQPDERVIEAMAECMRGGFYNPSSLYAPAMEAEKAMDGCRARILRALGVTEGRVIFTSGGTEANNLAIWGALGALHAPKHVVMGATEHPSVRAACDALEAQGIRVTCLAVDREGQIDWASLDQALTEQPALVSVMHVNNETGAITDIARLSSQVRRRAARALIHVDGVQGFLRVPFDARLCDLYTLSGHKIHGPKGIGALWTRSSVRLAPRQVGGGQEYQLRSGTENTPGIAGLRAAIECMPKGAPERIMQKKLRFAEALRARVAELTVNGPAPERAAPHILNVSFPGVRGEVMLHALEAEGVYVSTGSACSSKKRKLSPVLLSMGIAPDVAECAVRFSLCPHSTDEQIDYAADKAATVYAALKRFRRK